MAKTRLFNVTYWLLNAGAILCIIGAGLLVLALGGVLAAFNAALADKFEIPAMMDGVARNHVLVIAAVAVLGGVICLALAFLAFRAIAKVVESAMTGDPFVVENADRLTRTGWLLLSIYGIGIAIALTVTLLLPPELRDGKHHEHFNVQVGGPDISPVGLLAILLIFVLAQIFRHGSEMRAELEGTV